MANVRPRSAKERGSTPAPSYNRLSDYVTHQAASGGEAKLQAEVIEAENRERRRQGKIKTVKIDSNPTPGKTRIGNLAQPSRGGAGGAFIENLK